ncbi:MAG: hypothetical protein CMF82_03050 [Candidatus Marinimicrobia bacterium]|nr:hypothetical protein [Candidatus Neomarinimicrobiota bacterium]
MSSKKEIDIKSLSKQLESLIDIAGESCGPILINELKARIDKTVDLFNKDVDEILTSLFNLYHSRRNRCKKKISSKETDDFEVKETVSPEFIKSYEKKSKNKL